MFCFVFFNFTVSLKVEILLLNVFVYFSRSFLMFRVLLGGIIEGASTLTVIINLSSSVGATF